MGFTKAYSKLMAEAVENCSCCHTTLMSLTKDLADHINSFTHENAKIIGESAICSSSRLTYNKKRMRIDEDIVHEVAVGKVRRGDVRNPSDAVRGTDLGISTETARQWSENHCLTTQAAALRVFFKPVHTHLTADSTRMGQPAEDVTLFFSWEATVDQGLPLIPQATEWYIYSNT